MNIDFRTTVNDVVMHNLRAARVLNQYDIDLLTQGKRSLGEVCREANISFARLLRRIREAPAHHPAAPEDPDELTLDELIGFIERYHHRDIADTIAFLRPNLARLVRLHGRTHAGLEEINGVFREMAAHLTIHMEHEELILFPYIRKMARQGRRVRSEIYKSVQSPIATLEHDHDMERKCLKRLDELTHHFTAPGDGCILFRVTYASLKELEQDLRAHMRLENEVLFPKALEMETRINAGPRPGRSILKRR